MNSKIESQDTQQNPNNSLRPMSSIFSDVFQTMNRAKKERMFKYMILIFTYLYMRNVGADIFDRCSNLDLSNYLDSQYSFMVEIDPYDIL